MPQMSPMVDYAITVVNEPGNPNHQRNVSAWAEYRRYIAGVRGPKIVVVQHLDEPRLVEVCWGEANRNTHRALGCVGIITDGSGRGRRRDHVLE